MAHHYSPNIITNGLVFYIDFANNKSYSGGSTVYDLTKYSNNPSLVNGPSFVNEKYGSISMDGVDDHILVASDGLGKFDYQDFTIDFWYKTDSSFASYDSLWSYDYTSHVDPYYSQHIRIDLAPIVFVGTNYNGVFQTQSTDEILLTSTWYNIVWSRTSGESLIYVNGVVRSSSSSTGTINYYNQEVWIGKSNFEASSHGGYSSVKFYNRRLSNSEVLQNFNTVRSRYGI